MFWKQNIYLIHHPQFPIYESVNLVSIGSDNGLSPIRRQAIIQTNAGFLWISPIGTNLIEILNQNTKFSFTRMHSKISLAKWRPFFSGGGGDKLTVNSKLNYTNSWSKIHTYIFSE